MISHHCSLRTPLVYSLIAALLLTGAAVSAVAQDASRLSGEPIVVVRIAGWDRESINDYTRRLSADLNLSETALQALGESQEGNEGQSVIKAPVRGVLIYRADAFLASAAVHFSEVTDQAEFTRLVHYHKNTAGADATLEGADDRLTLVTRSSPVPIPACGLLSVVRTLTRSSRSRSLAAANRPELSGRRFLRSQSMRSAG